jgi:hypothetical protein
VEGSLGKLLQGCLGRGKSCTRGGRRGQERACQAKASKHSVWESWVCSKRTKEGCEGN